MVYWFARRRPEVKRLKRARLSLEGLEERYCLDGNPPPPVITLLTATVLTGHRVELSGTVSDNNPANIAVVFSGAVAGNTSTNTTGGFDYITSNASLGTVTAVATDSYNQQSNPVSVTISVPAPTISKSVTYNPRTSVTISGSVTDIDAASLSVSFSGKMTGAAADDANGNYTFTQNASGLGTVNLSTTNLWGVSSPVTFVQLTCPNPQIIYFQGQEAPGNVWTLTGTVSDRTPSGLTVTFSGLPSWNNVQATVTPGNTFSAVETMGTSENGPVQATVKNWWGLVSSPVQFVIQQ
jgi:hypothetical protein